MTFLTAVMSILPLSFFSDDESMYASLMEIMPSPGSLSGSACSFASCEDAVSAIAPPPDVMRLAFASVPVTERLSPVSMLTLRP